MGNGSIGGDVIWDVHATSHSHHLTDSSLLSKGHVPKPCGSGKHLRYNSQISVDYNKKTVTQPTSLLIALWGIMDSSPVHI
ncbi:hypothetical protein GDO81_018573 [Engystomops pustulosus]|uniref:Uncharacterized protein n=1 Tax=Engystomops pustulosus TaxID=76066 RepID=A0AAV6YLB2_ENGPU|nr:hypothetical protein GDO81_018573 [Engystomops pustulosus]